VLKNLQPRWRNVGLALVGILLLWFAWSVRSALNPLGLGLLFAYMLHPMVASLEARGWSRKLAVNVIFGAAFAGVTLTLLVLVQQGHELWTDLATSKEGEPSVLAVLDRRLENGFNATVAWIEDKGVDIGEEGLESEREPTERTFTLQKGFEQLQSWFLEEGHLASAGQAGLKAAGGAWAVLRRVFGSILTFALYAMLVPIYTWFLLFELERISNFVRTYLPRRERQRFSRIGSQITEMLGNFFRGRMLVCLLKGLILAVAMWLLGIPYAFLLGILSGFLSLIPFVGPTIGYGLAFLLALIQHSILDAAWRMVLVYTVGELLEGYVLLPRVVGDSLGLHPVVVVASLMVFGAALGMFGMLLALPITAAAVILVRELVLPALKDFAEERSAPSG
jgi:predicted PurR-regulated permease PerM